MCLRAVGRTEMTIEEIYDESIKPLAPSERFRLATLILSEIPPQSVVDIRDAWNEEGMRDVSHGDGRRIVVAWSDRNNSRHRIARKTECLCTILGGRASVRAASRPGSGEASPSQFADVVRTRHSPEGGAPAEPRKPELGRSLALQGSVHRFSGGQSSC